MKIIKIKDSILYESFIAAYHPPQGNIKRGGFLYSSMPSDSSYDKRYILISSYYLSQLARRFKSLKPDIRNIALAEGELLALGVGDETDNKRVLRFNWHNYYVYVKAEIDVIDLGMQKQLFPNFSDPPDYSTTEIIRTAHCYLVYRVNSIE